MVNIIKSTGDKEPFSEEKLRESIRRTGMEKNLEEEVVAHVKSKLYENIPSKEVYKHVKEFLNKDQKHLSFKYSLKQAIMNLGPTGYPFEDYVSEILKTKGYSTKVRQIFTGKCVSHEVDVVAEKDNVEKLMIEAKFHNEIGIRSDLHVTLYTKARFDDIKEKFGFDRCWLFTNTKITDDALTYALCVNMGVVSWNYPQNESLRDLVENTKLYPITIIESFSKLQLQTLLENHVVLVKDICKNKNVLNLLNLPQDKLDKIFQDCLLVCDLK